MNITLTPKGEKYIHLPSRNQNGHITVSYFQDLILMYTVENGNYHPTEFKKYVQTLNILEDMDWQRMTTRNYNIWKHHIDRAKQVLLDQQLFVKNQDNKTYSISTKEFDNALALVSDYINISHI